MVNIIKRELEIEESLRKKIEFICEFTNIKPIFRNGCIRKIDKTNLIYIEPHSITIKNINFLFFNYSNDIFINNLSNKIKVSELENYIKTNQDYCYQFKYYNTNINMYSYLAIEYISEVYISEYKNK